MRRLVIGSLTFLLSLLCAGSGAQQANQAGRVVILGFDGMDPMLCEAMISKGELPNLQKLAESGMFTPLTTTSPPQSPTAWSSFITCRTPLNHGIFDFLRRDPRTHLPNVGFGRAKRPELAPDGALTSPPAYENYRHGESFWRVASTAGKRVKALVVPFAYPADDLSENCLQLCGLDVPDIRGTQSTYFALAESFAAEEPVPGGMRLPLRFQGDRARVEIPGIAVPGAPAGTFARVPVDLRVDRADGSAAISLQGQTAQLRVGEWSEWMEWTFALSEKYSVQAISRFHLMECGGDEVRFYMTCLNIHPEAPMMPISAPGSYAGELSERYGMYKTVGWTYDTKALEQGDMTDAMFLDDVARTMNWSEQLTLDEIDRGGFDLLIAAWTATDRVSHMYWAERDPEHPAHTAERAARYGRVVEETYMKADAIVGEVMARLAPEDLLMVLSDHGFHSFRYGFSVNTWLARNGYLAVRGQPDSATAYTDDKYLQGIDWQRTRAYGLGLGMVFLNLQGRERFGIVPKSEAPTLLEELKAGLLATRDETRGAPVFRNVYSYLDPQGVAAAEAPDLQLGYDEGYQTEKSSAAGAVPKDIFTPNHDHWSGEHAASDVAFTPGIFFANRKLAPAPRIQDLGVTALDLLGVPIPGDFEGKSLALP